MVSHKCSTQIASIVLLATLFLGTVVVEAWVPNTTPKTVVVPRVTTSTTSSSSTSTKLNAFFQDLMGNLTNKKAPTTTKEPEKPVYDPVLIKPDFRVATAFLVAGLALDQVPYIQWTVGPLVTALGLLFLVQTARVRFRFNEDNALEILTVKNPFTGELQMSGENVVVGGANVWAVDTIVNYGFFPAIGSSPVGPVLVYFKETQTDSSTWNQGPGQSANDPEKIAAGTAVAGQVHFFPAVCNAEQLRDEFVKRNCAKL